MSLIAKGPTPMATKAIAAAANAIQQYSVVFSKLSENISNASTPGFKANNSVFSDTASSSSSSKSAGEPDLLTMGPLKKTGNNLDVAIRSPYGMFALTSQINDPNPTPGVQHFTRDGHMRLHEQPDDPGRYLLIHGASNRAVLGHTLPLDGPTLANAAPIFVPKVFDVDGNGRPAVRILINDKGIIEATYDAVTNTEPPVIRQLARLAITRVQGHQVEERPHQNVYQLKDNVFGNTDIIKSDVVITPKHIEGSNIQMQEMFAALITTQRTFQSVAKTLTTSDEMLAQLSELKK
ncbi:MAG: flagellar basal body rod C-terminal domain-containing protein [Pseudomonadota bacterium]|nr:flagellar basal body rod C-terminal domain-containing protein [Pseudomonadota bacterium]